MIKRGQELEIFDTTTMHREGCRIDQECSCAKNRENRGRYKY